MDELRVVAIDHSRVRIDAPKSVLAELGELLTFQIPNAKFDPRVRAGRWDGRIRLLDRTSRTCGRGLAVGVLPKFCKSRGISYSQEGLEDPSQVSIDQVRKLLDDVEVPSKFERRDYQMDAIRVAVETGRRVLLSPTSSGKSLIIYGICQWYGKRSLILVPTVGLVRQMIGDFKEYGSTLSVHAIQDGKEVPPGTDVVVATWQTVFKLDPEWLEQFGVMIGDEAHLFRAQSLSKIVENARTIPVKIGLTGTLDGSKTHRFQLEALFGPVHQVTTTRELIDEGTVADAQVELVVFQHPEKAKAALEALKEEARSKVPRSQKGSVSYRTETDFVMGCQARNRFICKMATRLEGNVLILFNQIAHGDDLFERLVTDSSRPVHLINGGVEGLERDEIRGVIETSSDAILLASVGTSSTGMSIKRINHMILACPWKGRIFTLQSLGRGLRTAADKTEVTVYDLGDELDEGCYSLRHMGERVKHYRSEKIPHRLTKIPLEY